MTSSEKVYLAVDIGASSGRVLAGLFDGAKIRLEEVHRFENASVNVLGHLHWDILRLWSEVQNGLLAARVKYGDSIASVGVDTWGVDFGLLGRNDELLGNPTTYRDSRTNDYEKAFLTVPRDEIFAATGLQFMEINTLYQLWAMKQANSPQLDVAQSFLMIPDLFHWLLTGVKANEYTNASTTQFLDPTNRTWAKDLLSKFDLPTDILGDIIMPGTNLGSIAESVAVTTGLRNVNVVVPGTHDTASAVMAVPAEGEPQAQPNWAYISSGTWSLMGVETPQPIINSKCSELNFTNEGGISGTSRVLKNIGGLWLVQECRRIWKQQGHEFGWGELIRRAESAQPLAALIPPDNSRFTAPADMPTAIRAYCKETGQPEPKDEGEVIRCALQSLALRYRMVLGWCEELTGGTIDTIHIVGGGTQNRLLNQMTADACNRRVVTGPVEATAIGNVMMQAVSDGVVGGVAEARQVIRNSFEVETYEPSIPQIWDGAFSRFEQLVD